MCVHRFAGSQRSTGSRVHPTLRTMEGKLVVVRKTAVVAGSPVAVVGSPAVGDSPAVVADSHHTVPVGDIRNIRIVVAAGRRRSWSP